jgi:pectinesterase
MAIYVCSNEYIPMKILVKITGLCLISLFFLPVAKAQSVADRRIIVAQDGSGDFTSIQGAVNSVRDLGQWRVIIFIKKGTYHEKLVIPSWKTKITLLGEDRDGTIITNSDYSGKIHAGGPDAFGNQKFSTYTSYTVLVQGTDFQAENLTIENASGKVGQAVALHVEADRTVIYHCRLLGNQDTLYAAVEGSRQYYRDCYIAGTTDFIFGEAIAVFDHCTIQSLANSYITAAATPAGQQFGFVFQGCELLADSTVTKVYLGRPWRPFAKTVFIECRLGKHIVPAGWDPWKGDVMFKDKEKTAFYAEYKNSGAGAVEPTNLINEKKERISWSKQLTKKEADKYKFEVILGGSDLWWNLKTGR